MRLKADTVIRISLAPDGKAQMCLVSGSEFFESTRFSPPLSRYHILDYAEGFRPQSRATASEPAWASSLSRAFSIPVSAILCSSDCWSLESDASCRWCGAGDAWLNRSSAWARVSPRLDASWW